MTTLLEDLQTVLKPLAAGGAFCQLNETQPPVLPYIVYQRIVSPTNHTLAGPSNTQNTRVQIDVYAGTIAAAEAISDTLGVALRAGPWAAAVDLSSQDFYEPDTRLNRISRDFSIWATN
jgi:hypothetical protein